MGCSLWGHRASDTTERLSTAQQHAVGPPELLSRWQLSVKSLVLVSWLLESMAANHLIGVEVTLQY